MIESNYQSMITSQVLYHLTNRATETILYTSFYSCVANLVGNTGIEPVVP